MRRSPTASGDQGNDCPNHLRSIWHFSTVTDCEGENNETDTSLDTGTHAALTQASVFVQTIEERQGLKIACLEEIAYRKKVLNAEQVLKQAEQYRNGYRQYLRDLVES